jgi:tetratricopeptide (TPR) repeat protein
MGGIVIVSRPLCVSAAACLASASFLSLALAATAPSGLAPSRAPQVTELERKQAQQSLRDKDWEHAIQAYVSIVEREPKNGAAWFNLGHAYHGAAKLPAAIDAFQRAADIGHNPVAMYDLACCHALAKDKEKALEWLDRAVQVGFDRSEQIRTDTDLESLRGEARFKAIVARAEAIEKPCAQSPESRQFDFWIGEWDVQDMSGHIVGQSSIQLILGSCVIFENWTGGSHSGKSFNAYNKDDGKWMQTWVDDQGDVTQFVNGELKDRAMRFETKKKASDGSTIDKHLTFFDLGDGRVRQFAELSKDGGRTWSTEYDFLYVRKT